MPAHFSASVLSEKLTELTEGIHVQNGNRKNPKGVEYYVITSERLDFKDDPAENVMIDIGFRIG